MGLGDNTKSAKSGVSGDDTAPAGRSNVKGKGKGKERTA